MNSMNKYQAKRYLVLMTHILAIICLILELVICFVFERENFETNDIKWVFRWVILSNILNGTIIAVQSVLVKKFEGKLYEQSFVICICLTLICTVIACQHYYFSNTQLIFIVPIMLTIPVMRKRLNIVICLLGGAGMALSFFFRYYNKNTQTNYLPDLAIAATYMMVISFVSSHLIDFLKAQGEKLVESKKEAEKANNAKSDFLSNMSHEIRTPINSILGMNEMILRESKDETITGYAENIAFSGKILLSLINDVLDISKIESGKIEIAEGEYKLEEVLRETVNMVKDRIEKKELKFIIDADENLPSVLKGDEGRIRQVVVNLLTNAAKYTSSGSVTYTISGNVDRENEILSLRFSVKDTGSGIKEEDLKRIYGRFERFDLDRNRNIEGTGLGLRISKQLAQLMGGDIEVKSEYGVGSEFIFTLTQKIVSFDSIGKIQFDKNPSAGENKYSVSFKAPGAKILVVDDIDINLFVIENLLKLTEMKVDLAQSGIECIEKTTKEKYDLILIDHMMPGMDGIATHQNIVDDEKNLNRETPCVMLTANAFSGARELYEAEGFLGYITKPVECDKLESMVSFLLPQDKVEYLKFE